MIYHVLDRQFNSLTVIDTDADNSIVVENDVHLNELINNTLLNTLSMEIVKNTGTKINNYDPNSPYETSFVKEGCYIVFQDENGKNVCCSIRAIEDETEEVRPISAVDLGLELRNGSASRFESRDFQYIDYYVNREIYDSGWEIGINELGTDIKRLVDTNEDETPLARLQRICEAFSCEMTFNVEFQNMIITKKIINIYRKIGSDRTDTTLFSGVDIVTMRKSVDIDNVITAIEDVNHGFDDLADGDGRFYTNKGESIVYDREANALYGRGNTFEDRFRGWVMGQYESSGNSQFDNYVELRNILDERSQPMFSAEVELMYQDKDFEVGDWLTFVDEEYNPPLRIKARVLSKEIHRSNRAENKIEIGNYQLLRSLISSDLLAKQQQMNEKEPSYAIKLTSDNGTSFINGESKTTTLSATIFKDGQVITREIKPEELLWFKVDKEGNHDKIWEDAQVNAGTNVVINDEDFSETTSIRCVLTKFENYFVQAIYFLNGLRTLARRVLQMQTKDTVTMIHVSDTHYATDSVIRDDLENFGRSVNHIKNVAEFTNFVDVDYVVLNGDNHDGSTANKSIATQNLKQVVSTLGLCRCPYFISWGNHDDNGWGDARKSSRTKAVLNYQPKEVLQKVHGKLSQVITNKEMHEIVTRTSTIFNVVENPEDKMGYFYYDVPDKKQRVIVLNTQDIPLILDTDGFCKYINLYVSGYRQKQITWLRDTLRNTPADVTVTIFQHFPFGKRYNDDYGYYPYNYEMVDGLIKAFVSGGTYSRTYNSNPDFAASISADFTGRGLGKLAFLAHGHTHQDKISIGADGIVDYSISCSVSRPKKEQLDRPLGQLEEDLWDVVLINTKTRHVDLLRFGAGTDRSFDY